MSGQELVLGKWGVPSFEEVELVGVVGLQHSPASRLPKYQDLWELTFSVVIIVLCHWIGLDWTGLDWILESLRSDECFEIERGFTEVHSLSFSH